MANNKLIELRDLKTYFYTEDGVVKAVDGVSFSIEKQKTLGVVGESGCGKSVTALSIMGLVPMPPGKIVGGSIIYHRNGQEIDLTKLDPKGKQYREIRGNEIAMIFQEPMTSLNPVYTIGNQIMEAIILHQKVSKREARARAIEMLKAVGIPLPEQRIDEYPHQLSGGMRQRAMIAMALSCNPHLLIADEPTTALDVTIQAQILDLIRKLQSEFHMALMMITHNLGVIAEMADDVVIMYMGKVVEEAPVREIYHQPTHPYTIGLMESIPALTRKKERLKPIKGMVPDPYNLPKGCPFEPRCPEAMAICREQMPELKEVRPRHRVACWARF
ncbi:MAG: ABC transporter ATP-binding protein [Candidatus Bipolaricaulota bacterium]|nr:ABC transporter ATP-binding protein [Candidatus Bipolaricaulota bacterium]MDW8031328.1 ABC transporter ATP-binding protein [Candidatus Bipolaricaulota bacterium]